jgi:hypothetical protein
MSNQENRPQAQLGAIFDELINSIGETKQAIWSASSTDRRIRLEALKAYLVAQAVLVDEAELRLGGRPPWIVSPTGHHPRNLAAEAAGNPDRFVDLLVAHLETVEEDIRLRNASTEGEWHLFLGELADGLAARIGALKQD